MVLRWMRTKRAGSRHASMAATVEDDREVYGEPRLQSLAMWRGRVVFLVWTERQDAAHLISCRYADRSQIQGYFENL